MTGMERLLARIKALFEPTRPVPPEQEVDVRPEPSAAAAPIPEAPPLVSITRVDEAPLAEPTPAVVADAPIVVEEAADEAPAEAEHEVEPEVEHEVEPEAPVVRAGVLALRLESERGSRSIFEVTKSGATIGRGPESTIQLADLSVSRKHARIAYRQGAYWLSDLGSMGGTWVDGSKLAAPRRVATGQTIDIGVCRLTVISAGAEEEPAAARTTPQAASRR
jgi:hypothetical protein